jgi:Fe-S-cluster-containing hydrogenase component 2
MTKESVKLESSSRKYIAVDPSKCTGCGICEYACALEKSEDLLNPLKSRIRVLRLHPLLLNTTMVCRFCEDAQCVTACPEKALTQCQSSGILIVDKHKCNGCDWCIQACPHGGITIDSDTGLAIACDLCDGEPKCIDACPEEALELVSEEDAAEKTWKTAMQKLPSEIEKLAEQAKKNEWSNIIAKAEERAKKTSEKLEAISKRETLRKKKS